MWLNADAVLAEAKHVQMDTPMVSNPVTTYGP
jgi:hypothetical protein